MLTTFYSQILRLIRKWISGREFFLSAVILVSLLSVNSWLSFRNINLVRHDAELVIHTQKVINALEAALSFAKDAETGQRGYLLTGKQSYLEPYNHAVPAIYGQLALLKQLTRDNASQQKRLDEFKARIGLRLKVLDEVINAQEGLRYQFTRKTLLGDRGKVEMDALRRQAATIEKVERDLLEQRTERSTVSYHIALFTSFLSSSIGLGLLVAFLFLLRKHLISKDKDMAAIFEQHERFRITIGSIGDAVLTTDTQGRVTYLNEIAQKLTGWKEKDAFGKPLEVVLHILNESSRRIVESPAYQALREGTIVGLAYGTLLIAKDGKEIQIEDSAAPIRNQQGDVVGVVLVFRDVTDRKKSEAVLLESEKRYRQLIQGLPAAVYTCDADGYIMLYNPAAAVLWGREPELGKELWCGSHRIYRSNGEPLPLEQCPMAVVLEGKEPKRGQEIIIERPDGTRRNVLPYPQAILNKDGILMGAINMLVDITERKKAEQDLIRTAKELAASNTELEKANIQLKKSTHELELANISLKKLDEMKTNFIAIASHELKTPLTAMKGFLSLVIEGANGKLRAAQKESLLFVKEGSDRMHRLIDSLLNLSKMELGQMPMKMSEKVSVKRILSETVRTFHNLAEKKSISIQEEVESDLKEVCGDEDRLREVFDNLVSNALKYTPRGGTIWIRAKNNSKKVEIKIEDTGIGMRKEDLCKIFEPFQHLRRSGLEGEESTGLGLALVRKIIDAHGGEVQVESVLGKGSIFMVLLPQKNLMEAAR